MRTIVGSMSKYSARPPATQPTTTVIRASAHSETQAAVETAIEIGYRVGRLLVYREVLRQAPAGFSAATKCFCTEHEWRVAEFVARTFGAEAMLWNDVTSGLVYAPGYTIMGGTSNIMRNILGERVLGLPKEPAVDRDIPWKDVARSG